MKPPQNPIYRVFVHDLNLFVILESTDIFLFYYSTIDGQNLIIVKALSLSHAMVPANS